MSDPAKMYPSNTHLVLEFLDLGKLELLLLPPRR